VSKSKSHFPRCADYVVKDIGLAEWGAKEISIAETEMPGLMATREEYGPEQPLRGAKIAGSPAHEPSQTAVLIETLKALGADVRWASCNIYSTQDHAAAAVAAAGTPVFAVKGESLEDYGITPTASSNGPDGSGPNMILDDGGDATLLMHLGMQAESNAAVIAKPTNEEEEVLFAAIKKRSRTSPAGTTATAKNLQRRHEETTTGVHRLYQMGEGRPAAVPAINVNDSATNRNSTIFMAAANRWSTASAAAPT